MLALLILLTWWNNVTGLPFFSAQVEENAIAGRTVVIPARDYQLAFKVAPMELGSCALKMEGATIKTCSYRFGGNKMFLPKASTTMDVSVVRTADDILTHGMGGVGVSVGILGLLSAGVKVNVAVTTVTNSLSLTLMSSYTLQRGTFLLQNAQPVTKIGPEGALYLSEISLGGDELFLVTLQFKSIETKVEVETILTTKLIFFTITAKLQYINTNVATSSSTRIQLKSSWRENLDKTYSSMEDALEEVKKVEEMYSSGPEALNLLDINDEKLHSTYYFSSWRTLPYGKGVNLALLNNEVDELTKQHAEVLSIINQINELSRKPLANENRKNLLKLNSTLTEINSKLDTALETYYTLTESERDNLINIYGKDRAPFYFQRKLNMIIGM